MNEASRLYKRIQRTQVAADYGVTPECIGQIRNRRSWRHVL